MRVTMRNWQPAAGSRYQDQTRTAAPGSEAERASGIPVQTETAATVISVRKTQHRMIFISLSADRYRIRPAF